MKNLIIKKVFIFTILSAIFILFLSLVKGFSFADCWCHMWINRNVLLSLISIIFGIMFYKKTGKISWIYFVIALLFLPNSPYMITDSTHLSEELSKRWFDSVLFFSAGLYGVVAYLFVIYLFFEKLRQKFSDLKIKFFIYALAPLSAFGIYLGRTEEFLDNGERRLNSWYVLTHPQMLFDKIFLVVTNPLKYPEFLPTFFAFSAFLLFITFGLFYFLKIIEKK